MSFKKWKESGKTNFVTWFNSTDTKRHPTYNQHEIINEIFYIVLNSVFQIRCVFYNYSTTQFKLCTFQSPIATCIQWLPCGRDAFWTCLNVSGFNALPFFKSLFHRKSSSLWSPASISHPHISCCRKTRSEEEGEEKNILRMENRERKPRKAPWCAGSREPIYFFSGILQASC